MGAQPALQELYLFLDQLEKADLMNKAAKHGMDCSWKIHPADSPHRNGSAEAAVQLVKRALHILGGDRVFTWDELMAGLRVKKAAYNTSGQNPFSDIELHRGDTQDVLTLKVTSTKGYK